jgi:hypothetical protein
MNRNTVVVAAAVVAATVVAVPAVAASGTKTVTERFDAKSSSAPLTVSKTALVLTDNDVNGSTTIGRDVLYCTGVGAGTSHCHVSFAQKGGVLYAQFSMSGNGTLKGTVTGGTGSFAHAKGTLAGRAVSQKDVTITLHYKK